MAFATSNVQSGVRGNLKYLKGDWSGLIGDASGTIAIATPRVYQVMFYNHDADVPKEYPQTDVAVSSGIATVTVHNHMNVTNGQFMIEYA